MLWMMRVWIWLPSAFLRAEASSTRLVLAGSETLPFRKSMCTCADLAVSAYPCIDIEHRVICRRRKRFRRCSCL